MDARFHIGIVTGPLSPLVRFLIEGISIRIDADAPELTQDHACDEFLQFGVVVDQRQIRPDLGAGIPEPHRVDIAGIDKSVIVTDRMDGRVKGVGETVGEHPRQPVVLEKLRDFLYLGFDGGGDKEPLAFRRTLRFVLFCMA